MKEFKVNGKIVDRQKANIKLVDAIKRKKFDEEILHDPSNTDRYIKNPDEFDYIKGFARNEKAIQKKKAEYFFDFNGDNKPLKKKKESRIDKLRKPFTIRNGKKHYKDYHKL